MGKWFYRLWEYWIADIYKTSKDSFEGVVFFIGLVVASLGLIGFSLKITPQAIGVAGFVLGTLMVLRGILWLPVVKHQKQVEKIAALNKQLTDPHIDLVIEPLPEKDRNNYFDLGGIGYCHHLHLKILTPNKKLEGCSVWLKELKVLGTNETFNVDSRLEFYPSEKNHDIRDVAKEQKFDLGKTMSPLLVIPPVPNQYAQMAAMASRLPNFATYFELTIDRDSQTWIRRLEGERAKFAEGVTLELTLYVTASNYHDRKEFKFQILIKQNRISPKGIETSIITPFNSGSGQ